MPIVNENVQLLVNGAAVTDANPMPIAAVPAKTASLPLFGGAIAASVAETEATVIDMRKYTKGELQFLVNSGAGTFSCAFYTSDIATGVFKPLYQEKADKSGWEAKPALVTTTTVSACYELAGFKGNYLKIVPAKSATINATFAFTPSI